MKPIKDNEYYIDYTDGDLATHYHGTACCLSETPQDIDGICYEFILPGSSETAMFTEKSIICLSNDFPKGGVVGKKVKQEDLWYDDLPKTTVEKFELLNALFNKAIEIQDFYEGGREVKVDIELILCLRKYLSVCWEDEKKKPKITIK